MASTPLLLLPLEMLEKVTDYLDFADRARLSMTNRYLRFMVRAPTHSEFLIAEAGTWATSRQLYACRGCVRFRGLLQFADDMRKGACARSGPEARARFCLECGVAKGWYSEGAKIAIYGKPAVLVRECSSVTDHCVSTPSCGSGTLTWTPLYKKVPSWYADDDRRGHDDGWAYLTRSNTESRYGQEEHVLWFEL